MHMDRYRVKIKRREITYLWGGPGIKTNVTRPLLVPVLLTLRVDDLGEEIEFGFKGSGGLDDSYGKLRPGESYTVSLDNLTAIWAKAEHDCYVDCQLTAPFTVAGRS